MGSGHFDTAFNTRSMRLSVTPHPPTPVPLNTHWGAFKIYIKDDNNNNTNAFNDLISSVIQRFQYTCSMSCFKMKFNMMPSTTHISEEHRTRLPVPRSNPLKLVPLGLKSRRHSCHQTKLDFSRQKNEDAPIFTQIGPRLYKRLWENYFLLSPVQI